jgi:hypothetical protein
VKFFAVISGKRAANNRLPEAYFEAGASTAKCEEEEEKGDWFCYLHLWFGFGEK